VLFVLFPPQQFCFWLHKNRFSNGSHQADEKAKNKAEQGRKMAQKSL
jgi:hypothetical protein